MMEATVPNVSLSNLVSQEDDAPAPGSHCTGNNAVHNACYSKAIEMYNFAIALWNNNAIYFCNRAAIFAKMDGFDDAIRDCREAIKLEPTYMLAYYRLSCAYYDQGRNIEAICEGPIKVLQLDPHNPHNEAAMISLQLAEAKLRDDLAWVREQIESLGSSGVIPITSDARQPARQSTMLVLRGPEEGGDGGPWELVEEMGGASDDDQDDDGNTITLADFIDMHVRHTPPLE